MKTGLLLAVVGAFACFPALAANEDLKAELEQKDQALASLGRQIDSLLGADFIASSDIVATLRISALQKWAAFISSPELVISAYGLTADDLYYVGGSYKVWLQNPADTKARIALKPLAFTGGLDQLTLTSSSVTAHAETRVFASAAGLTTNVFCQTAPDISSTFRVRLALDTSNPASQSFPFVLNLIDPPNLIAQVVCYFGGLGNFGLSFPISDLARELGRGAIDLGYSKTIEVKIPTNPPTTIAVPVRTQDGKVSIDKDAVTVSVKVAVGAQATR